MKNIKVAVLVMSVICASVIGGFIYSGFTHKEKTPVVETRGEEAKVEVEESRDRNEDHVWTNGDEPAGTEEQLLEEFEDCIADKDRSAVDCCNVPESQVKKCVRHVLKERNVE